MYRLFSINFHITLKESECVTKDLSTNPPAVLRSMSVGHPVTTTNVDKMKTEPSSPAHIAMTDMHKVRSDTREPVSIPPASVGVSVAQIPGVCTDSCHVVF